MINTRFRNSVKQAKTYPGADIGSDHNSVVATVKINLKKDKGESKHGTVQYGHAQRRTEEAAIRSLSKQYIRLS